MIEEEMTAAPAPEQEPAAAPRRRASRKTASAEADQAQSAQSQDSEQEPAARRRGRPRKAAAASDEQDKSAETAPDAEGAPKRRTRKSAAKKAEEGELAGKPEQEQGKEPASGAGDAPAAEASSHEGSKGGSAHEGQSGSRRRGRPRKTVTTDTGKAVSEGQGKESRKVGHQGSSQQAAERSRHEGKNQRFQRNDNQGNRHQRQRRNGGQREVQPSVNKDELAKLKVAELRAKAAELELDAAGLKKAELVDAVYEASVKAEGFIEVAGVLDVLADGYGFLRTQGYLPSESDCYVSLSTIRRNGLRKGDMVHGVTRPARENEKYAAIQKIISVNDVPAEELGTRVKFSELTPIYPDECLRMEHGKSAITARVIDLVSPIGKGQRGLIVSPPKAGKTTILKDVASAITANNPEVHLMCLLVDERPEEVTDMQRSIKGEVISSTFDMPTESHIAVSELVIERAKRLVECGKDVVILLDSITRLARAYNLAQPASGRILSGGVDSTALYPPKRFLGAARNIENGGSLTILASALIDTGSKMDEVIFEEFKGTGNMELKLDRNLADRRIFPAIDPVASGTRKEDLLLDPQQAPLIWAVRRILANLNNTERAMDMLIKSLRQTDTNTEFLLRTAKKAQHAKMDSAVEL